jgi:hypothetical protein
MTLRDIAQEEWRHVPQWWHHPERIVDRLVAGVLHALVAEVCRGLTAAEKDLLVTLCEGHDLTARTHCWTVEDLCWVQAAAEAISTRRRPGGNL